MDSCSKSLRDSSPFDCLLFDLDETLYPASLGIGQATKRNIDDFLVEKCGFPATQAPTLRVELFKTYGSSLAGLRLLGYEIDADDYHSFVHGRLPYDSIKPDPQLRNLLRSINQRKIIFTNSDRKHATKALDRLGIRDCFEKIICFETLNPNLSKSTRPDEFPVVLKPSLDAFRIAIDVAEIDPRRTLFLDDSIRNVAAGKALGLRTALVGKSGKFKEADYAFETVNSLTQAIPEIWLAEGDNDIDNQRLSRTRSQIDLALATAPVGA
jgi:putative hydrolase of the HAD superfamily